MEPKPLPPMPVESSRAFFSEMEAEVDSIADLLREQAKDPFCVEITEKLKTIKSEKYPFQQRSDGVLVRVTKEGKQDRVVVPLSGLASILRKYHGLPLSAHLGARRVTTLMSDNFYWPRMRPTVRRWIRSCVVCQRRKTPRPMRAGLRQTMCTDAPFRTVAMDLVGILSPSEAGNGTPPYRYLLTMIDTFTRWPIIVPIADKTAPTVAHAAFTHLLCVHGCPNMILTDRGAEFVNKGFKAMCEDWNIPKIETSPRHSKANGHIERFHRYLNSAMTALTSTHGANWHLFADAMLFAYCTSVHDATGFSPFELLYGRRPRLPQVVHFNFRERDYKTEREYLISATEAMTTAYSKVRIQQQRMADKNRMRLEKHQQIVEYKVGEYVLLWRRQSKTIINGYNATKKLRASGKWVNTWTRPQIVTKRVSTNTYDVRDPETAQVSRSCHVNMMHPFTPWSDSVLTTDRTAFQSVPWKSGGEIAKEALIAVPLPEGKFGIGKLLEADDGDKLLFQWWGNDDESCTKTATFAPAWLKGSKKQLVHYYRHEPENPKHLPYTSRTGTPFVPCEINRDGVLLHDFEMEQVRVKAKGDLLAHKLSSAVRKAIESARSGWEVEESEASSIPSDLSSRSS
jgi:transposase InsO family protein